MFKVRLSTVKYWISIFIFFVVAAPQAVPAMIEGIETVFKLCILVFAAGYIYSAIVRRMVPSQMTLLLLAFNICLIVSSAVYKREIVTTAMWNGLRVFVLSMMYDCNRQKIFPVFCAGRDYFRAVVLINFLIVCICFPDGLYTRPDGTPAYFLGYKNAFILYYIPAVYFSLVDYFRNNKKTWLVILYTASIISSFLADSTTAIVSLSVSLIMLIWVKMNEHLRIKRKKVRPINLWTIVVVYLFTNIAMVLSQWFFQLEFVRYIVETVLGKSLTFTGRLDIWLLAVGMIVQHPVLGYGVGGNINIWSTQWYAHNQILEILLEGGAIALLVFSLIFRCVIHRSQNTKISYAFRSMAVILPCILCFFLTEAETLFYFVPVYIFSTGIDQYVEGNAP